jgi:hypothetical protein
MISTAIASINDNHKAFCILSVGDGDLSASLALKRAYGSQIRLIATTLLASPDELRQTYPHAAPEELELVYYGVDATQLHCNECLLQHKPFDLIIFHHPHLGYSSLQDSNDHARLHSILLAHYFYSSQQMLAPKGQIHVALCGSQCRKWKLPSIWKRLGMTLSGRPIFASHPFLTHLQPSGNHQGPIDSHWLSQYGYTHQPTFPSQTRFAESDSINTHHYFVRPSGATRQPSSRDKVCPICLEVLDTTEAFQRHWEAPAQSKEL